MKRKSATPNRARLIQAYILRTLLFGAAGGILGCQFARPNSLVVPLQYSPTDNVATSFTVSKNPARLYVATITDKRDMQDKIGENEETSSKMIPVMAGTLTPAVYVHNAVVNQLRASGVAIVDSPGEADRVLSLTLIKFWAVENPDYQAIVRLNGTLTDKSGGNTMWNGVIAGADATFGRSLSIENYNQVLSNAVNKAAGSLLKQTQFAQALSMQ